MPEPKDPQKVLIQQISDTIIAFNLNVVALIQDAQLPLPGDTANSAYERVKNLFEQKRLLEDAQWEITNRRLAENNAEYKDLMAEAKKAAKDTAADINQLKSFATTMSRIAKVIDLIGRILIKFAL